MSCRRAQEIDLMAFATDRHASEWAEFRAHYPACPDCSRAVAALGALEARLAAHGPSAGRAHLTEDELFAVADERLGTAERARVETHLAACAACRSELAVLQHFPLDAAPAAVDLRAAAGETSSSAVSVGDDSVGWLAELGEWLASLMRPAPALGLAAAVAALLVLWTTLGPEEPGREEAPRVVQQPAPLTPSTVPPRTTTPEGPAPLEDSTTGPLLAETPSPPADLEASEAAEAVGDGDLAGDEVELAESPPVQTPAPPSDGSARPSPAPDATRDAGAPEEREIVLLAALLPSEMPVYVRPRGEIFDALGAMRPGGSLRSEGGQRPRLSVLAPPHLGATRQASPRLYWALDRPFEGPVEIVVTEPESDAPVLEMILDGPLEPGLHAIDLRQASIELAPHTTYEWSVALIVDPAAREQDVVSQGGIRRREAVAGASAGRPAADRERAWAIHRLAGEGDWYDAFDRVNRWIEEAPDNERLARYRRSLLEQAELAAVGEWLGAPAGDAP